MVYTIGDLHLSFGCNKPMDIFGGWTNHIERLTENWNGTVKQDDTVIIIGDISWAMDLKNAYADFDFINKLNGKKIIIKGNHDYWWTTMKKMEEFLDANFFDTIKLLNNNAFLVEGISVCGTRGWINETGEPLDAKVLAREAGRLEASLTMGKKLGGELIAFIHYPPIYGTEENYSILDVLKKYDVRKCYYGHIHGSAISHALNGIRGDIEYKLVSADGVGFCPVLIK